ncbi:MAG: hypothetical protein K0V04_13735 [Deltaproteobacteria bacterium]|nr:hypothetical protein [Deltaproteobacteria bacterium]
MMLRTMLALTAFAAVTGVATVTSAAFTWSPYFSEESQPPQEFCTSVGQAVDGVRCQGSYCDDIGIRCNDLPFGMTAEGHNWEALITDDPDAAIPLGTIGTHSYIVSDEYGHVCGLGSGILTGLHCSGSYCDDVTLQCATPTMDYQGAKVPGELVNCFWSNYYSEEDPWFAYGATANLWISGIECYGSYCDSKKYRVCELANPASCEDTCGAQASAGCWCDSQCTELGDCCEDYVSACSTRN